MNDTLIVIIFGFIGTLITIMTPIIKLNSSITKLNVSIDNINSSLLENKRINENHEEKIQEHEIRLTKLEAKER